MSTLIRLTTPTETASYEGCALALTLATFGHSVQLLLSNRIFGILLQKDARIHGMIQSLDLYDIPPAWINEDVFSGWIFGMVPKELATQLQLIPETVNMVQFDQVLSF